MKNRNYIPITGKITKKVGLTDDTVGLTIRIPGAPFTFVPGQFVMVSVLGFGEIPVGISSSPSSKKEIEIAVRRLGTVSDKICGLEVGEEIGLSGPFGNGLPMSKLRGKNVVIVAGGLGMPPLRSFIKHIGENPKYVKSLTILNGARSSKELLYRDEYPEWSKFSKLELTVDTCGKDWTGCVGQITALFPKVKVKPGSVMLVCGPPVMFKPIIDQYAGKRVAEDDMYLFLERRMHCGIGKCQHCTCGKEYVCLDGPIFPYSKLKYNEEAFK
jgi:sulfhydrogenase subunit gamma (sulfur reductase)